MKSALATGRQYDPRAVRYSTDIEGPVQSSNRLSFSPGVRHRLNTTRHRTDHKKTIVAAARETCSPPRKRCISRPGLTRQVGVNNNTPLALPYVPSRHQSVIVKQKKATTDKTPFHDRKRHHTNATNTNLTIPGCTSPSFSSLPVT